MAISDDTILELARELGVLNGTLTEAVSTMKNHVVDPQAHSGIIPRTESLEKSRRWFRRVAIASVVTPTAGGTVAAKMGWLGKIMAAVTTGGGT